jgi:hypothetical protein
VLSCNGLFDVVDNHFVAEMMRPRMENEAHDVFNDPVFNVSLGHVRKKRTDSRARRPRLRRAC